MKTRDNHYKNEQLVKCCWSCNFSDKKPISNGIMKCSKNNSDCNVLGVCDNFFGTYPLTNSMESTKSMTKEERLELSRQELKAMQLEALINVTKEFLETCDDSLEREVLDQLASFQDELKEIKENYKLDF